MKKIVSVLLAVALLLTLVPVYAFAEEIVSISYTPKNQITRYFEQGGGVELDNNNHEYYHYNAVQRSSGDIFTVNYSSGKVDYVLEFNPEPVYVSTVDPNDVIDGNEVDMYGQQSIEHFNLGNDNKLYVRYGGKTCYINVNIVINPIKSIVYTPVENIVIYENVDGRWVNDGDTDYFEYNAPPFKEGDTLTVNYLGGDSVVYTLQSNDAGDDWILRSADGQTLNNEEITVDDQQWEKHWKPGENEFIIKYHGASASVKVNIRHTPSDWIIDKKPGLYKTGLKHKECTACGEVLETEIIPVVDPSLPRVEIESLKANAGETIDVKVLVRNNPGINSMKLSISYDTDLTLENVAFSDDIGNLAIASQSLESPMILNFIYGDKNFDTADYTFAVLTFKISDGASDGLKYVSASYDQENVYNINEYHVEFETVDGGIDVESYLPGDINGDGKVNNKDITRLMQYLSGWSVSVNEPALDVNNDGSVNNKDITRLFKYLSGWDVAIY